MLTASIEFLCFFLVPGLKFQGSFKGFPLRVPLGACHVQNSCSLGALVLHRQRTDMQINSSLLSLSLSLSLPLYVYV